VWVSDPCELVSSELQVNHCVVCVNSHLLDSQSHEGCLQQVKPKEHVHCLILSAFQTGQMAVSLAVQMAVSWAVQMAVSLAVQKAVSLGVQMAVSLAVQMAVSLAV
jgi:hypothetical protein